MLACFPTMTFCWHLNSVQMGPFGRKLGLDLQYANLASMYPLLEYCYNLLCAPANVPFGILCYSTVLILVRI